MKVVKLTLTGREIELFREAAAALGETDPETIRFQLKVVSAILDAETLGKST